MALSSFRGWKTEITFNRQLQQIRLSPRLQTEFSTTLEEQEEQRATIALQYSRPHDAAQTVSNSSKKITV